MRAKLAPQVDELLGGPYPHRGETTMTESKTSTLGAIGPQECTRCKDRQAPALIDDAYLVGDPRDATSALCPRCARDDDPLHIVQSWLLTWN